MTENLYEILALAARYAFVALMALVVVRGSRITFIDNRRAASLRRYSPETGIVGELRVLKGSERIRRGTAFPVIREGMIGQSRRADIRLRSKSVLRCHAHFEMSDDGLHVYAEPSARMEYKHRPARNALLRDGDSIRLGNIILLFVRTKMPQEQPAPDDSPSLSDNAPDDTSPDGLFASVDFVPEQVPKQEVTHHAPKKTVPKR